MCRLWRAIAFPVLWVVGAIASTKNGIILVFSRIKIMEIEEFKAIIKESIREVLREERMLLCQILIPYVSDEEQEELDEMFGSPSDYEDEELVDMTEWVKHGHKIS
ncbi:MAG: hypothetical protein ACKO9I_10580 [Sphaerospermopsis kisseleviana]